MTLDFINSTIKNISDLKSKKHILSALEARINNQSFNEYSISVSNVEPKIILDLKHFYPFRKKSAQMNDIQSHIIPIFSRPK